MANKRRPIKTRVMSIVHGQSELLICSSIKSNLKIKHEIISKHKGGHSIQVNGLVNLLQTDTRFRCIEDFARNFKDIERQKNKLMNFKLFIIMDVDDCEEKTKERFMSKALFRNHWLYDYIVPIYNEPKLEKTMEKCKIEVEKKKDYIKIFPTNKGDLDIKMAQEFSDTLRKCDSTNLEVYIDYCLTLVTKET
ncbi:hypothetical protein [Scatolibacter rhodanostii]|uniref:hypothetical protein n=1 Tax=Scatolibacter rhodanostii TaxID=2014781 RepID=UPI000C06BAC7|nr:hypothetical protein [Scatolibacter rhodanostii]